MMSPLSFIKAALLIDCLLSMFTFFSISGLQNSFQQKLNEISKELIARRVAKSFFFVKHILNFIYLLPTVSNLILSYTHMLKFTSAPFIHERCTSVIDVKCLFTSLSSSSSYHDDRIRNIKCQNISSSK